MYIGCISQWSVKIDQRTLGLLLFGVQSIKELDLLIFCVLEKTIFTRGGKIKIWFFCSAIGH